MPKLFLIISVSLLPLFLQGQGLPAFVQHGQQTELYLGSFQVATVHLSGSQQPLLGRKVDRNDSIFFSPALPFQPNLVYVLRQDSLIQASLPMPDRIHSTPRILRLEPVLDTLPANLLKIYLYFSEPISAGSPYAFVHLLDAGGDTLSAPFLKQDPALWNKNQTRLTLWLDPGRIKRDLPLQQLHGPPLSPSESYTLATSSGWTSAKGEALGQSYAFTFVTDSIDHSSPDVSRWELSYPSPGEISPLIVQFDEALVPATLEGRLRIFKQGVAVAGTGLLGKKGRRWTFFPKEKWTAGIYSLEADPRIEDWAGNNLARPFDRDLRKAERLKPYKISFTLTKSD